MFFSCTQNKLMQQPLAHLYFLTVMEDLKDSNFGLAGLVKTVHNISKVSGSGPADVCVCVCVCVWWAGVDLQTCVCVCVCVVGRGGPADVCVWWVEVDLQTCVVGGGGPNLSKAFATIYGMEVGLFIDSLLVLFTRTYIYKCVVHFFQYFPCSVSTGLRVTSVTAVTTRSLTHTVLQAVS